jgi:hypothetical protein
LNRLRTLPQALADLISKYETMRQNHPRRPEVARMIGVLETEIALRGG